MTHILWLAAVPVALVSNLDNLTVGVALGIRKTRIAATRNVTVALVTMAATAGAMTSGRALSVLLPSSAAQALGSAVIIVVGVVTMVASSGGSGTTTSPPLLERLGIHRETGVGDTLSHGEALVLGVALSLNNVGTGVGAGVAGVPPLATTLLAGLFSLLAVGGGAAVGRLLTRPFTGGRARFVAGGVLVALGATMLPGVL